MHRIGTVELGATPRVAVALRDSDETAGVAEAVAQGVDILEFRVDQFAQSDAQYARTVLNAFGTTPRLLTIRSQAEGGAFGGSEADRLALYEQLMAEAQAVDIEIGATDIFPEVAQAARDGEARIIGSYHNFETTPSLAELGDLASLGFEQGADIVKVAAQCNSQEALQTLAAFTLGWRHRGIIVIGMGPMGAASRIFFPALGSLITYTFLGEATAPGQFRCAETLSHLAAFYPMRGTQPPA